MNYQSRIAAIGVALPRLALPLDELARHLQTDPAKYAVGLGSITQALCDHDESPVSLGQRAALDALRQWGGDPARIGLLAVGTESALDMSRPLSAWIAEGLPLSSTVRSYEVKHACQAGTIALRQAVEWLRSGAARGKAALIVATDEALYRPGHPGEPTQGAAAVAMIVDSEGFADVAAYSYAWQKPAFDFFRPVGQAYPEVDGPFSVQCYQEAFTSCVTQWRDDPDAPFSPDTVDQWAMHAPFPKMVWKGFHAGMTALSVSEADARQRFDETVSPALAWNTQVGNCYTASSWLALARALSLPNSGEKIALFSYGSGCGAELVLVTRTEAIAQEFSQGVQAQLSARQVLSADAYRVLRERR